MKKYTYYFKDVDIKVEADTGDEAMFKFSRITNKSFDYNGIIELTNNITNVVNIMYPIKVV